MASATAWLHRLEIYLFRVVYYFVAYAQHVTLASAHVNDGSSYWTLLQLWYGSYYGVVTLSTSGSCLMNVLNINQCSLPWALPRVCRWCAYRLDVRQMCSEGLKKIVLVNLM